jgi:MFS superfamily sulfate permease-like transporter
VAATIRKATSQPNARVARFLPIVGWLPQYQRVWLRSDLIAGLSMWALMVPTSLGYAAISGVPVQYGLYAAVRTYASKHNYPIDINQELLAQGMSNISSGLFQGIYNK